MATSTETQPPLKAPDGSSYGTPADRPVALDDCKRFDTFLAAADAARALVDASDVDATAARLVGPLTAHYNDFDYVLATAQPAVWHDALTVVNYLYALGVAKPADGAVADQALANIRSWHDANCSSLTTG